MNYLYLIPPVTEESGDLFPHDGTAVLIGTTESGFRKCLSSTEVVGANLVGQWDNDGKIHFVDSGSYEENFAPFMNTAEGFATDKQDVAHWQGHKMRQMQEVVAPNTAPVYPADRQPFVVTMERYEETEGTYPGWYWMFVVEFADPSRDPGVRTVGVYDNNWNYLYTVGGLVLEDIQVGEDEDGDPVYEQKYVGRCPAGHQTTEPEDVYYSLLYASTIEGKMILSAGEMKRVDYYWEHSVPAPPGEPGEWSPDSVYYYVDDEVTYEGSNYKCLQAHTSQAGWTPSATPSLWQLIEE